MIIKVLFFSGCLFLSYLVGVSYGIASPLPLPHPVQLENFNTGKSNKSTELKDIYASCNESFKILPGQLALNLLQ